MGRLSNCALRQNMSVSAFSTLRDSDFLPLHPQRTGRFVRQPSLLNSHLNSARGDRAPDDPLGAGLFTVLQLRFVPTAFVIQDPAPAIDLLGSSSCYCVNYGPENTLLSAKSFRIPPHFAW